MRISKVESWNACNVWAADWWAKRKGEFSKHAQIAALPISQLEPGFWPDRMTALADAFGWAKLFESEIRECEMQAVALLTATVDANGKPMTTAKAEAQCYELHALVKMMKQLAETADRKLSTLQSLNRQR